MIRPLVSVIIIVFNGETFLRDAIESVLVQTFDDYELLIVNDGSTDTTAVIAEGYRRQSPERIRVLGHPGLANKGMSASRNLGLAHARGELIAFLDADDVWLPRKLAEQVQIMQEHPTAGLNYGRALIWRSWETHSESSDFFYDLGVEPDRLYSPPDLFLRQLRNQDQTPTTSGSMIRRSLIDQVGGFEPMFKAMFEDQVFFAKALLASPVWVSGATWFRYRQHGASASANSAAAGADERARVLFLRWLVAYVAKQPERARELAAIRSALHRARLARARSFLRKLRRLSH